MNVLFITYTVMCCISLCILLSLLYLTFIKKMINKKMWGFISLGVVLLLNFSFLYNKGTEVNEKLSLEIKAPNNFITTMKNDNSINDGIFYKYLLKTRVKNPKIIFCQGKHESSSYSSPLYNRARNLFGMKVSEKRVCVGGEESGEYQSYTDWKQSITDYIIYGYENNLDKLTEDEYIKFLSTGVYGRDPLYSTKIRKMLNSIDFEKLSK